MLRSLAGRPLRPQISRVLKSEVGWSRILRIAFLALYVEQPSCFASSVMFRLGTAANASRAASSPLGLPANSLNSCSAFGGSVFPFICVFLVILFYVWSPRYLNLFNQF